MHYKKMCSNLEQCRSLAVTRHFPLLFRSSILLPYYKMADRMIVDEGLSLDPTCLLPPIALTCLVLNCLSIASQVRTKGRGFSSNDGTFPLLQTLRWQIR